LELERKKNSFLESDINLSSCNEILKSWKKESGVYKITLKYTWEVIKVFCDMKTDWWWWTLLLTSQTAWWNYNDVLLNNYEFPSINENYSILSKWDFIKTIKNWKFQYRIDAYKFWEFWWIWEAPEEYSFISKMRSNFNINLVKKYWNWRYSNLWIEKRMPYLCNSAYGLLTTSTSCYSKWFWTLVARNRSFDPAPWFNNWMKNPGIIWYWVK
jgi:hypothetical protein